jgi:signal transduction histidine kinase
MAICTDITRIKEMEKRNKIMRASFFSSIAHELRTPLNSIIPILRMIIEALNIKDGDKILKYLKIVLNSSLHL